MFLWSQVVLRRSCSNRFSSGDVIITILVMFTKQTDVLSISPATSRLPNAKYNYQVFCSSHSQSPSAADCHVIRFSHQLYPSTGDYDEPTSPPTWLENSYIRGRSWWKRRKDEKCFWLFNSNPAKSIKILIYASPLARQVYACCLPGDVHKWEVFDKRCLLYNLLCQSAKGKEIPSEIHWFYIKCTADS